MASAAAAPAAEESKAPAAPFDREKIIAFFGHCRQYCKGDALDAAVAGKADEDDRKAAVMAAVKAEYTGAWNRIVGRAAEGAEEADIDESVNKAMQQLVGVGRDMELFKQYVQPRGWGGGVCSLCHAAYVANAHRNLMVL